MLKKLKKLKSKRNQTNYINNHNSLINIEQLNMKVEEAFWFGVGVGAFTIFTILCLKSDKSAKKENKGT